MNLLFAFLEGILAPQHIIIVLVVGILLFGKRLPEVGRYLGKGIVEFKKGIKGLEDDVDGGNPVQTARNDPQVEQRPPQRVTPSAPKFEEPAAAPLPAPPRSTAPKFEESVGTKDQDGYIH